MNFKTCNTCHKNLPDNKESFLPALKKGGIWGTTIKCRRCANASAVERRLIREITKLMEQANV